MKKPEKLYVTFNKGPQPKKELVAEACFDSRGEASIRFYDFSPNCKGNFLMGTPSAKKIAKWLISASKWIEQEGGT